ncbi:hypothetical protein CWO85_01030 [Candidatus Phytoplasma ziziphi]|uniref:ATPase domain-containing protein n=1 Tax=Ziziphus jujuba witches'-broom phytoplasma TaxID=135727 RepID=A0A660HMM6_ZIZJU|nr:ATP-binding protein [Candidatus Phytoplasma ziziphi]AYJ01119.1 hypothetical protein CWO85_01030 [Candidatus Phytoplasma ziziphi]
MFIGRKKELEEIENLISTSKFEFALIYGRRQIGKTTILQKIIKKYKGFYFVADRSGLKANLKRLSREITNFLKESDILFDNFYDLFEFIVKRVNKKN